MGITEAARLDDASVDCPVCGRVIFQAIVEYLLGRPGAPPVRWPQRWRHLDDRSLACEQPAATDA